MIKAIVYLPAGVLERDFTQDLRNLCDLGAEVSVISIGDGEVPRDAVVSAAFDDPYMREGAHRTDKIIAAAEDRIARSGGVVKSIEHFGMTLEDHMDRLRFAHGYHHTPMLPEPLRAFYVHALTARYAQHQGGDAVNEGVRAGWGQVLNRLLDAASGVNDPAVMRARLIDMLREDAEEAERSVSDYDTEYSSTAARAMANTLEGAFAAAVSITVRPDSVVARGPRQRI